MIGIGLFDQVRPQDASMRVNGIENPEPHLVDVRPQIRRRHLPEDREEMHRAEPELPVQETDTRRQARRHRGPRLRGIRQGAVIRTDMPDHRADGI